MFDSQWMLLVGEGWSGFPASPAAVSNRLISRKPVRRLPEEAADSISEKQDPMGYEKQVANNIP